MDPNPAAQGAILRSIEPESARNQAISQIATQFSYVSSDVRVEVLSEALSEDQTVSAVGVVDRGGKVIGVVDRAQFLGLLSRPYGRDVLRNLEVTEVMSTVPSFRHTTNLFTVAEEISDALRENEISYFVMTDEHGGFRGIFSTHDLLLHLSNMTQSDIALARKLQSRLVRERELVAGKTFEFSAYSASARGVGGDFYSIQRYADDDWFVSLCDVSGKGVSASIVTSVMWGMMSIYDFRAGMRPFIVELNNYMVRTFEAEKFVTGVFMTYNEKSGEIQLCDMGHSHIFLFRGDRMLRVTTNQNNLPLGVVVDVKPKISRFVPQTEDILLVVTDGLLEQENADGEVFSLERVAKILRRRRGKPVELTNDILIGDFDEFRGSHHLNDDVTYSMMRFVKQDVTL